MSLVIVAGALANKHRHGGGAWERLSWVTGLRRLGCEVYFVEQIAARACVDGGGAPASFAGSVNAVWFRGVTKWFGVGERSALICGEECLGLPWPRLLEVASEADLLVNLSGHLTVKPLLERIGRKAYIDVDPGFTQFWHTDPDTPFELPQHDHYLTIGENIGQPDCSIPTAGLPWRPIRQPVVLTDWPATTTETKRRFTTVASWRGAYGPVRDGARLFGLKVHEFRKYLALPRAVAGPMAFEIALDIHPGDSRDLAALHEHGWLITTPSEAAGDPEAFRRYIQTSAAEFSVAQGIYVETASGWFSERTIRYLASGKPALVQDTGFSRNLPVGEGLLAFRTLEEAVAGAEEIVRNYDLHCRAARAIAETYFDSDKVLGRFLNELDVPWTPAENR